MRIFNCDHCEQLVFYENIRCLKCTRPLAYLPDLEEISSIEHVGGNHWKTPAKEAAGRKYRPCENYSKENVCNWAVPADDPDPLCISCRLTRVIPDLNTPGNREAWYKLELAKRRLVYSLLGLNLPLANKTDDPEQGLAFEFLADLEPDPATAPDAPPPKPVLTGHADGVIIINIAEADDPEREKRRLAMHEPYRTLLGHFRHEVGHYYWDRLIKNSPRLEPFRELFGDEQVDYGEALQRHYQDGPPSDWQQRFVSTYASSHAWEDWAETWAHYLHMFDTLETAAVCGLSLRPARADQPTLTPDRALRAGRLGSFDKMIENWFSLTYVLNMLNRGLGQPDGYPFVLPPPAVEKLRFIHETVVAAGKAPPV